MAKSITTCNNLLKLIFNATAWANMADNAATSPYTNLYVGLYTADPGTITAISFLNGAYPIVNLTTPPYTYTWTNPPAGTYTLFAKASVSTNSRSFSTPVVITVLGAQPRLTIQANPLLVNLAWPIGVDGWLVQGATNLTGPWLLTGQTVIDNATQHQTTLTPERQQYYRLTLPR